MGSCGLLLAFVLVALVHTQTSYVVAFVGVNNRREFLSRGRCLNNDFHCSRTPSSTVLRVLEENPYGATDFSNDDEMMEMMRDLENRQKQVLAIEEDQASKVRLANCESGVSLVLPDWIRRLDVDYPLVACGSSKDDIYLAHLETGQILASTGASTREEHALRSTALPQERIDHVINQIFGKFDGGGTLAVALERTLLCEARRSGGVHVWRLSAAGEEESYLSEKVDLVYQGFIPALQDCIVTCMQLKENYLWVGTDDGSVEAYSVDVDAQLPLTLRMQPDMLWKVSRGTGVVTSLDVSPESGCAVYTTDAGTVELLCLEDDEEEQLTRKPIGSFTPPFDGTERRSSNVFPTCALIVLANNMRCSKNASGIHSSRQKSVSIACGASDGSLFLQSVRMDGDEIDTDRPFVGQKIRTVMPKHFAAVTCMASPSPGLLISGAQDGTLRCWDTTARDDKFLYQFVGYKVWLGSLWTDGQRVVTDGADNTVITHDFGAGDDNHGKSRRPEDRSKDKDV